MFMKNFLNGNICSTYYSKDSTFYYDAKKKIICKMKDEYGGAIIDEFVGLKSKMCSIKKIDDKEWNTAKRVNNAT